MRQMLFIVVAAGIAPVSPAAAQTPSSSAQISTIRVEFTRPGGIPGNARGTAKVSESYMLAPAQPGTSVKRKRR